MKGKNPYEIRLETAQLAFQILAHRVDDDGKPVSITTEQVLEEAEKLNNFISTAKRTNFS